MRRASHRHWRLDRHRRECLCYLYDQRTCESFFAHCQGRPGSLPRPYSDLRLVEDLSKDAREVESELPADVLLVEADTLSDPAAREALDWAGGGATVVLLIRYPAAESVAEALRAGLKAVLRSDIDGPESGRQLRRRPWG